MSTVSGRERHYGDFYGLPPASSRTGSSPDTAPVSGARPLLLVHGNCQAESLRILLDASDQLGVRAIRIPPVFEMSARDIPFLRRLAGRSRILISQPVADNYRDLPLGTAQLAAMMPAGSRVVRCPIVRFTGLHPYQAIIRDPRDRSRNPPVVAYHDLRTLASAATGKDLLAAVPSCAAARSVADASRRELGRREQKDCDVMISDVFDRPMTGDMATINHPGNRVLVELARRIQQALGCPPDAQDPGRVLLGEVFAPVLVPVLRALGISGRGRASWRIDGRTVRQSTVQRSQRHWYTDNPAVVEAGYLRHRTTLELLGLG